MCVCVCVGVCVCVCVCMCALKGGGGVYKQYFKINKKSSTNLSPKVFFSFA